MEFKEYWERLLEHNPKLNNDTFTLKQSGLKNMLEQSYNKGHIQGVETTTRIWKASDTIGGDNIFKNMFGK